MMEEGERLPPHIKHYVSLSPSTSPPRSIKSSTHKQAPFLLPILPHPEVQSGMLDIEPEAQSRVVYLTPLPTVATEKMVMKQKLHEHSKHHHSLHQHHKDTNIDTGEELTTITITGGGNSSSHVNEDIDDVDEGDIDYNASSSSLVSSTIPRNFLAEENVTCYPMILALTSSPSNKKKKKKSKNKDKSGSTGTHHFVTAMDFFDLDEALHGKKPKAPDLNALANLKDPAFQVKKLKQQLHLLPTTEEEKKTFWDTIRDYKRLKKQTLERLNRQNHVQDPMVFNFQAAWHPEMILQRHLAWLEWHEQKLIDSKTKKKLEEEKILYHLQQTTTEYRIQMRHLKQMQEKNIEESKILLPTFYMALFAQRMKQTLHQHWEFVRLKKTIHQIGTIWQETQRQRDVHTKAALVLIIWLQRSVAIKGIAFKVFRGLRFYLRRVKKIQRIWRCKIARRHRQLILLEIKWIQEENKMIEKAKEKYDQNMKKTKEQQAVERRRKKKNQQNQISESDLDGLSLSLIRSKRNIVMKQQQQQLRTAAQPDPDKWLVTVDSTIRLQVIRQYLRDREKEFVQHFRQQEQDYLPHLIQTLRLEQPTKSRSYIKQIATKYILLGRVYTTLKAIPGALKEENYVPVALPRVEDAPILELIRKGKEQSPPDETGARFGRRFPVQQQQQQAQAARAGAGAGAGAGGTVSVTVVTTISSSHSEDIPELLIASPIQEEDQVASSILSSEATQEESEQEAEDESEVEQSEEEQ